MGSDTNVGMLQVIWREELSSVFPTSSTVILGSRPSIIQKRISDRIACLLFPGRAGHRIICAHEITARIYYHEKTFG